PPYHPRRKRELREAGRVADTGGRGADPGWTAAASRGLRRRDARVQRRAGQAAHAVVDAPVPHPALCLPRTRPCMGDGGQGPLRRGRGLTHRPFGACSTYPLVTLWLPLPRSAVAVTLLGRQLFLAGNC